MKTSTRLLSLLLSFILCIACLIGCNTENAQAGDETTQKNHPQTTAAQTTAPVEDETTNGDLTTNPEGETTTSQGPAVTSSPQDTVTPPQTSENVTYPGKTITVIASNYDWFKDEIYVEAETGTAIPDAVYQRNYCVQKKLGITLKTALQDATSGPSGSQKVLGEIEKQLSGGLNNYSVAVANSYSTAAKAMEGRFVDLTNLSPYFDLGKSYWSQSLNDSFSIGDAQYICSGDMVLSYHRLMYATFINETMFENYGAELPYDKVENKEWTLAAQRSLIETFCNATTDQDPSATYGFVVNHDNIGVDVYLSALKIPLIKKDANNMLVTSTDVNRTAAAMQELSQLIYPRTKGTLRISSYGNDSEQTDIAKKFAAGEAAMVHLRLMELEGEYLRQMEDIFGIVPMPMLNSEQGGYYTIAHDQISVIAVPNTNKSSSELEMIGAFLDLMGYYSATEITPQYYEICLKGRYLENPTAQNMLDILTKGLYIDPAFIYSEALGSPVGYWRGWVATNKTYVTSALTVLEGSMKSHIDSINNAFKKPAK